VQDRRQMTWRVSYVITKNIYVFQLQHRIISKITNSREVYQWSFYVNEISSLSFVDLYLYRWFTWQNIEFSCNTCSYYFMSTSTYILTEYEQYFNVHWCHLVWITDRWIYSIYSVGWIARIVRLDDKHRLIVRVRTAKENLRCLSCMMSMTRRSHIDLFDMHY
jgi:hypothetical protein